MSSRPQVSVVIPVHNGGPHLAPAVSSVLRQDYPNLEVIVIDNGSTDGAAQALAGSDPRLLVTRYTEVVPAHENWTRAVRASRGDYVKLVCADDEVLPGAIGRQVAALEANPSAVVTAGRRRVIRENGEVLRDPWGLPGMTGLVAAPDAVRACVRSGTNPLGEPAAVMFRGDVLRSCMPWNAEAGYVIDLHMYLAVLRHGDLWADQDVVSTFRVSLGSWSTQAAKEQAADVHRLIDELARTHSDVLSAGDLRRGRVRASAMQLARSVVYWNERRREARGAGRSASSQQGVERSAQ